MFVVWRSWISNRERFLWSLNLITKIGWTPRRGVSLAQVCDQTSTSDLGIAFFSVNCKDFFRVFLIERANSGHPPTTLCSWRWVDESGTVDGVQWPNMERNSESGPAAELWRFRLFGIESRRWWGRLRVFDGLATACPRWSTASNYSHQLCRRKTASGRIEK